MKIGIDIGGVVVQQVDRLYPADQTTGPEPISADPPGGPETEDTALLADFRRTPPMPGAFEAVAALVAEMFGEHVYLVSKCGERVERRTRLWLDHHDFYPRTGVRPENVHFCRTRQGKAPIAAALGLTHFVDDRLEVLSYLETVPHRYLFRPREPEVRSHRSHLAAVRRVESWPELMALIGGADQTGVRIS
ncbi:hypothetical protein ACQEVC_22425 [Plantactinospora sp. CA-294935]|uniref:hypothetical protein n=1 Tax=Plantactinospora sp. CA-294935 TaxID=3240012 RepID=UPI003D8BDF47